MAAAPWPRDRQLIPTPCRACDTSGAAAGFFQGDNVDLSKLTDNERELLGRLLSKAAGEHDDDVIPVFRVVREVIDRNIETNPDEAADAN